MNKLYSLAFKRILNALSVQELKPGAVAPVLENNKIKPVGNFIYYRLPREDIRCFIKTPCAVPKYTQFYLVSKENKAKRS